MPKINVLEKEIYNLISAGEVVERPASVVKELIENSLDAGATKISVEIVNGGISKIKISDNGCGIEREDLRKAFMPHSTSKIKNATDLDSIATFGFRGEALCSIATVSKTTLISKVAGQDGNKIVIHGGDIVTEEPVGCVDGTTLQIEELFYNVPARAKFLKKPKQEEGEITNYIARLIMANPQIAIKYIADGKLVYQSPGTDLYEAIYSVYGKSIVDNLIQISSNIDGLSLEGYIGKPTFSKPNRTYQTLTVNNRYVLNSQISAAVSKAYDNFLMKGQFPFYVLNLKIPYDSVDVNVHPNKLEVRFENSSKIFGLVLNSISDKLLDLVTIKNVSSFEDAGFNNNANLSNLSSVFGSNYGYSNKNNENREEVITIEKPVEIDLSEEPTPQNNAITQDIEQEIKKNKESLAKFLIDDAEQNNTLHSDNGFAYDLAKNFTLHQQVEQQKIKIVNERNLNILEDNFKTIGVIFNTYILIEKDKSIYLIDQHAGHERILFDKFMDEISRNSISSQILLFPHILDLNINDFAFIRDNKEKIEDLGFELEEFGTNSYKITSVPHLLKDISLDEFFNLILKDASNREFTIKSTEFIKDYIAKCACKSAVKANDNLSNEEIEILLNMLKSTKTLLCPHGRPIIVEVSLKEIEKWFKRIV